MKTFEEQLVHFLDGQSAAIDEEELMAQMAVSPEKRELLRTHLHMRDAIARDAMALRPPRPLRDGTVALLMATAGAVIGGSAATAAGSKKGRTVLGKSAILGGGAILGALVTWALMSGRPAEPVQSGSGVAPIVQPQVTAPQHEATSAAPTVGAPEVRVLRERVIVPETVYVSAPPVFVHDTTMVPAPRVAPIAPTVTIQRETVYVAPKAGLHSN